MWWRDLFDLIVGAGKRPPPREVTEALQAEYDAAERERWTREGGGTAPDDAPPIFREGDDPKAL